jgi:hypothetical protein
MGKLTWQDGKGKFHKGKKKRKEKKRGHNDAVIEAIASLYYRTV